MLFKDVSLPTPQENILYDEVLLHLAEKGSIGEVIRFWESKELFIVLGRISKIEDDLKSEAVHRDRIPVLRRSSGGGTVLQGKGCLNYSLILSKEARPQLSGIRSSYEFILGQVVLALKRLNVEAVFCPISDIALVGNQKKISGNAQKRSKKYILHHGTLLYGFNLNKIEVYLKEPKETPAYRRGRRHLDFVDNIPVDVDQLKSVLKKIFGTTEEEYDLNEMEKIRLHELNRTRNVLISSEDLTINPRT